MKKKILKLTSIALSIIMLFSAMTTSATAENSEQVAATQKIDVVANALNLSDSVKNAINRAKDIILISILFLSIKTSFIL